MIETNKYINAFFISFSLFSTDAKVNASVLMFYFTSCPVSVYVLPSRSMRICVPRRTFFEVEDVSSLINECSSFNPKSYKSNNYKFNELISDTIDSFK